MADNNASTANPSPNRKPHVSSLKAANRGRRLVEHSYLTFTLGDELFALPLLDVREIIGRTEATPVPNMPSYLRGVFNLRGRVVPVIDLRQRLGMESVDDDRRTCLVIVQIGKENPTFSGLVIDRVREVREIHPDRIDANMSAEYKLNHSCFKGLVPEGDDVLIVLSVAQAAGISQAPSSAVNDSHPTFTPLS